MELLECHSTKNDPVLNTSQRREEIFSGKTLRFNPERQRFDASLSGNR
jgi:hypothetical protein